MQTKLYFSNSLNVQQSDIGLKANIFILEK